MTCSCRCRTATRLRAKPNFAKLLVEALVAKGVKVLVDVDRRDILGEPVTGVLLDVLELIVSDSAPSAWEHISAITSELRGDTDEEAAGRTRRSLVRFLAEQSQKLPPQNGAEDAVAVLLNTLLDFVGRDRFAIRHPQYVQGEFLDSVIKKLAAIISSELAKNTWPEIPNAVRGIGAVCVIL